MSLLYEDRIVIFIDILGFKRLVNETIDENGEEIPQKTEKINQILKIPDEYFEGDDISQSKMITKVSDSIIISFKYNEQNEVWSSLLDIIHLHINFLNHGVLIRGAISMGKLHHSDSKLFGPSLVEVYLHEFKASIYPRIILDEKVIKEGANHFLHFHSIAEEAIHRLLKKDHDGMYYVDYFSRSQGELDDPDYDFPCLLNKMRSLIVKGLEAHIDNPGTLVKFKWMQERFNKLVDAGKNETFLNDITDSAGSELADFYRQLEKI